MSEGYVSIGICVHRGCACWWRCMCQSCVYYCVGTYMVGSTMYMGGYMHLYGGHVIHGDVYVEGCLCVCMRDTERQRHTQREFLCEWKLLTLAKSKES